MYCVAMLSCPYVNYVKVHNWISPCMLYLCRCPIPVPSRRVRLFHVSQRKSAVAYENATRALWRRDPVARPHANSGAIFFECSNNWKCECQEPKRAYISMIMSDVSFLFISFNLCMTWRTWRMTFSRSEYNVLHPRTIITNTQVILFEYSNGNVRLSRSEARVYLNESFFLFRASSICMVLWTLRNDIFTMAITTLCLLPKFRVLTRTHFGDILHNVPNVTKSEARTYMHEWGVFPHTFQSLHDHMNMARWSFNDTSATLCVECKNIGKLRLAASVICSTIYERFKLQWNDVRVRAAHAAAR